MAYDPEELVRLKHLLDLGDRILRITDDHEARLKALEEEEQQEPDVATDAEVDEALDTLFPN